MKSKRILVTGCDGFVATNLVIKLLDLNYTVIGIYKNNKKLNPFNQLKNKNFIRIKLDINNKRNLQKLFEQYKFDCIFHLAAISQVLTSNKFPYYNYKTNIFGTINIFECIRMKCPETLVVFSSSDKAYGESKTLPYKENFPLNGLNPYDASKASADLIARSYHKSFNLKVVVTRFVNIYGPGDTNWNRLIPGTIKSIFKKQKIIIRSNGKFLRDYLYIDDVVDGYIKILKLHNANFDKIYGKAINFGDNRPKSVLSVVITILNLNKMKIKDNVIVLNKKNLEIKDQYSSNQLSKKLLNWKPAINFEKGLKETIKWYKKTYID